MKFPVFVKYPAITSAALLTTLMCFLSMQLLISGRLVQRSTSKPPALAAPLIPRFKDPETHEARAEPKRMMPAEPPPTPQNSPIELNKTNMVVKSPLPTFGSTAKILRDDTMTLQLQPPIQDLVPLYVVQPTYPFMAVMKDIEGFVVVHFGVRDNGTVINPVVVKSEPGTLFDDAALSAVSKFRFRPRIAGGDPVAVQDVQLKFVFKLHGDGTGPPGGTFVQQLLPGTRSYDH
jgi:protein TonB